MDGTGLPGDNDAACKSNSGLAACGFDLKDAVSGVRDMFSLPALTSSSKTNTESAKELAMGGVSEPKGILRVSSFQQQSSQQQDTLDFPAPTPMQRNTSTISWRDLKETK